jgi:transcriptional regulator with XRE-family HTH domain
MSQAELARRIHISQTALNQLELGQTHDPRFSIVANIAAVLGVSLDDFGIKERDSEYEPAAVA